MEWTLLNIVYNILGNGMDGSFIYFTELIARYRINYSINHITYILYMNAVHNFRSTWLVEMNLNKGLF